MTQSVWNMVLATSITRRRMRFSIFFIFFSLLPSLGDFVLHVNKDAYKKQTNKKLIALLSNKLLSRLWRLFQVRFSSRVISQGSKKPIQVLSAFIRQVTCTFWRRFLQLNGFLSPYKWILKLLRCCPFYVQELNLLLLLLLFGFGVFCLFVCLFVLLLFCLFFCFGFFVLIWYWLFCLLSSLGTFPKRNAGHFLSATLHAGGLPVLLSVSVVGGTLPWQSCFWALLGSATCACITCSPRDQGFAPYERLHYSEPVRRGSRENYWQNLSLQNPQPSYHDARASCFNRPQASCPKRVSAVPDPRRCLVFMFTSSFFFLMFQNAFPRECKNQNTFQSLLSRLSPLSASWTRD